MSCTVTVTTTAGNMVAPISMSAERPDFEELFRAHYERLVRALTLVAGDRERAADAVQDAFVKAHLKWRRVGRYDDPVGWVRRVAINKLRDEHRRDGRKRRALDRLSAEPAPFTDAPPHDELGELLDELPPQQRAAVALFYVDRASVAEIARALDVAEGTVKSNLHDARRKLRGVLDNREAAG